MRETNLILFLAASLIVIVAPGPDNILVLTRGVTLGRRGALVSAAGASTGLVCHSLLAAAGLSALLARSAAAFSVVKYAGATYLLYLGIRTLLNRERFVLSDEASPIGLKSVFIQAVASNVLNPKIAVFFPGVPAAIRRSFHRYSAPAAGAWPDLRPATWMLFSVIAFFSGGLERWLRRRSKFASGVGWLPGGVLVGLGLRLAFSERR